MLDDELLAKYPPDDKQRFNQLSQVGQVLDQLLDARLELHLPDHPDLDERGNRCGATNQMRRAVVLLAVIALGGCLPDRAKDVAACRAEADHFYQGYRAVDVDNPRSQYIIGCMAANGYDFTIVPSDCSSQNPLPTQPACYTHNSWLYWIIDQFRSH
jgi:hypothetical protein